MISYFFREDYMKNYYEEIAIVIENIEVNRRVRELQDNSEKLQAYWNIGKLLVEAQGGYDRAKYGDGLIKKWALKLVNNYGNGYNLSNLKRYRRFYLCFPKGAALRHQLSWTHIKSVLSIKN